MIGTAFSDPQRIRCGRSRTIRNATTRTIGNAIPDLTGTWPGRSHRIPKTESAPSNIPNIESFGFFLTDPLEIRVCGWASAEADDGFRPSPAPLDPSDGQAGGRP